jgi:hypothetical protein
VDRIGKEGAHMPKTFLALGLVSALVAVAVGLNRGGLDVYPMRIVGNSSSGYEILEGDKPLGDVYHVAFDGEIRWDFTNNTNPPEAVRFRLGDLEFNPTNCPVNWTGCEYSWPNLPHGETKQVSAVAQNEPDSYSFNIYIGKQGGAVRPVDPELQIDDFFPPLIALLMALLSVGFFFASWWTGRRGSRKP